MKLVTVAPDAERVAIDYLKPALASRGQDVTVGVTIPETWTTATKPHVQVALDGTPSVEYPVLSRATVRLTAWATKTTEAKALASLAMALMLAHPGSAEVASVGPLTGILPARDTATNAQLASITVSVRLRMAPVA